MEVTLTVKKFAELYKGTWSIYMYIFLVKLFVVSAFLMNITLISSALIMTIYEDDRSYRMAYIKWLAWSLWIDFCLVFWIFLILIIIGMCAA